MSHLGDWLIVAHKLITAPRGSAGGFCNVIKAGTFCRTIVWPCLPPIMLYQYIRAKDEDAFITELLYYKSGSNDAKAFYDTSRIGAAGHWRIQQDMEDIRAAANSE
eukprot:gnl/TRDRNA2_/TRDRNA2_179150_c0_seq1.p1 gnl/TRDRNA2_/TRDRNA2_179150_c0~~gnl/TRDRNA2_/TRDRNA2_179150_c0_seq1.p1  ORF type:complete len:106 (+),score=25.20 gnl/TRDRNA2_/TRDRNA2_179150_c0_seq1:83-400(+)